MAEVISVFTEPIVGEGRTYTVQACGRPLEYIWEGWIEFEGASGETLRTARETTQPTRDALQYWAGGLSKTYLEGALKRALKLEALTEAELVEFIVAAVSSEV